MATCEDTRSYTFRAPVNRVKNGDVVLIANHPCKVVQRKKAAPGKHGHAKTHVVGLDIFTGRKYDEILRHDAQMVVNQKDSYLLLDVEEEGALSLLSDAGVTRRDLNLPADPELSELIVRLFNEGLQLLLVVMSAMGREE
eukprot:CAMPEP_0174270114 /NCGR_PEP_ID=MMETSP0439-20130205/43348_1 /TAXON_ID=0 /ORGANISM="Stereomyxa ramosa, Strain Chinc5" /LENGTH=139 /DNA_ID=CAMNT_0015359257 /DNA_START=53 /DNA_END=469 /DNA_ORIENTATION=+